MSFRNVSKRFPARRSSVGSLRRRRVLVEQLESRQLLAGDVPAGETGFVESLPTAQQAQFGDVVLTDEGREVCLAFMAVGTAEGEDPIESQDDPGPVDLSAAIVQPAGPLAVGAAFTSEITFENAGPNDAIATDLDVTFDANLAGISWEREIIRAQPATVAVADLDGSNGLALQGIDAFDLSGFSVSGGGDFNNDGIDDFIIGATAQGGEAYVVFGTTSGFPANLALNALTGANGFTFQGSGADSNLGTSLDNAGDVNGDGIDDLIAGAPGADPGAVNDAGEAYVIFGRATFPAVISATTMLVTDGVKITGAPEGFNLGASVAGAGDVNGDGISDIIVGAPGKSVPNPDPPPAPASLSQGTSFVIFGRPSASPFPASVDVTALTGADGFEIGTSDVRVNLGLSVNGAGDINGDGFADVIVGSPDSAVSSGSGKVHVVFGKDTAFPATVDVTALTGADGFSIDAPRAGHLFGSSVAGVRDVNGDGFDDFMVADEINVSGASTIAAQSYVVFGSGTAFPASLDISALNGTNGVVIEAPAANHPGAMKVSDAGDVNGDGVVDLLIGLPAATDDALVLAGGGYVVFGSDTGFASPLNLSAVDGTNGFLIEGRGVSGLAGRSVGAAGDVNGDGLADVIVGAPLESPGATSIAGESYVVFGRGSTTTNGSGTISETLDLFPGDRVIYRVSATIAPGASGATVVNATTAVGAGVSDTNNTNDTDSASTLIQAGTAPTVESIQINDGGASRSQITSVTVTFDSVVEHGPLGNAFTITQIDSGTQVGIVGVGTDSTSGKTVATLTFDGASTVSRLGTGVLGNSLADGNYRLDIAAGSVVSAGVAMAADAVFGGQTFGQVPNDDFYRLLGEINSDGVRNNVDLTTIIPTLFSTINYRADLDTNGDGASNNIDLVDLLPTLFASRRL